MSQNDKPDFGRKMGLRKLAIIEGTCPGCGRKLCEISEIRGGGEEYPYNEIPNGEVAEVAKCVNCGEYLLSWKEEFGEEEVKQELAEWAGKEGLEYHEEMKHKFGKYWRREGFMGDTPSKLWKRAIKHFLMEELGRL